MTAQNGNSDVSQNHSDFSIEHILNRAGNNVSNVSRNFGLHFCDNSGTSPDLLDPYAWLQCTRYCPPKVPRTQKRFKPQKRQLGRHPRIPFTSHQLSVLEERFQQSPYLSSEAVIDLARHLHLADVRVKIWFQNRRARERREQLHSLASTSQENKTESSTSSINSELSPVPQTQNRTIQTNLSDYLAVVSGEVCLAKKEIR